MSQQSQTSDSDQGSDLVVVANRLPVDRKVAADGTATWKPSPGGLVSALEPVMQRNSGAWVGWTGQPGDAPEPFEARGIHLIPVELSKKDVEDFYEGMSNGALWPLYHDVIAQPQFHRHWWESYVRVNRRFAEKAAENSAENALVWVQDYQLQLVPQMLRALRPDLRIAFFNHIPFPPYEIFAQLPWRRQVLDGLLGADQLGFQRPADANNFLRACRRNGLATRRGLVHLPAEPRFGSPDHHPSREVRAAAFPISIDAEQVAALGQRPDIQERAREIRRELGDPKVVLLGVDRLDYTKGILHRLKAVEELFAEEVLSPPDAVLVQVATPSRDRVEEYEKMKRDVEVTVGRINGDYGQLGHPAVHYLHQSQDREELAALYLAADVMLVTPLRDGMNLVAKEYVATRHDEQGALVLSEFAGAAIELPQAFLINPHDIDGVKAAIVRAAGLSPREATRRMRAMRRRVFEFDVARWASTFLKVAASAAEPSTPGRVTTPPTESIELSAILAAAEAKNDPAAAEARAENDATQQVSVDEGRTHYEAGNFPDYDDKDLDDTEGLEEPGHVLDDPLVLIDPEDRRSPLSLGLVTALEGFAMHPSLLIALDFDGVISPIVPDPDAARPLPRALQHLNELSKMPGVRVALVSGRRLDDLERVATPPARALLVGSHGAEFRDPLGDSSVTAPLDAASKELLAKATAEMEAISARHPGTHVEVKPTGVVLHTRRAERPVAAQATQEALDGVATWTGIHLTHGKEVVELSVVSVTKGTALRRLRSVTGADAVLYAGDDVTDERAFAVLRSEAGDVSVRVGSGETRADHRLGSPHEVATMLGLLVDLCGE
ncbi:trehalose-phosphatase [Kineosporia succinea]|uniref:Trehalose 6-phosphate synthase/phosphatase n=1 Tax=Kineosporia succinea TaxID=84632 RepID=A0ABT9P2Z2_9ACTN|nr:trehalose-phosphatase [Kineosporia succinea]MDP9827028.1 trehalose 6-phosphate synthase/phosphatase [Kineosporia succinea]